MIVSSFIPPPSSFPRMRRPERVADIIREEISQIVGYELEDPRLTMVTVTDVRLSDNRRDAQVFVIVAGDFTSLGIASKKKASAWISCFGRLNKNGKATERMKDEN